MLPRILSLRKQVAVSIQFCSVTVAFSGGCPESKLGAGFSEAEIE